MPLKVLIGVVETHSVLKKWLTRNRYFKVQIAPNPKWQKTAEYDSLLNVDVNVDWQAANIFCEVVQIEMYIESRLAYWP